VNTEAAAGLLRPSLAEFVSVTIMLSRLGKKGKRTNGARGMNRMPPRPL
jgi:hypothetical protein